MKVSTIAPVLPFVALLAAVPVQARHATDNAYSTTQAEALSDAEAATLSFMREEEKLARDVYLTLYDTWGSRVFSNISRSEQRHMDAMKSQLERYGLPDPVIDDSVGVFQNEELAALYEDLVTRGSVSLEEALRVGGFIEELDIGDLEDAIAGSTHDGVVSAYENLMRGSRNHLRAFVRQIERLGVVYAAQVLDQQEVDAIVDSPVERGGRGRGRGWGRGHR